MRSSLLALLWFFCGQSLAAQTLRIGFSNHKPPYIFEGESRGLEYDIVVAAARQANLQIEPYFAPMARLHLLFSRGQLDAITDTNEQGGEPAFYSDSYIEYRNVVLALANRQLNIKTVADLAGYSISSFQQARFFLGPEFQAMAERNPNYREEPRQINRNRLLYSGRIELVVGDLRIFRYFNSQVADQVDVTQPISIYPLFPASAEQVAFRHAYQRDRFNQGLKAIRESGEYLRIEQRYADY